MHHAIIQQWSLWRGYDPLSLSFHQLFESCDECSVGVAHAEFGSVEIRASYWGYVKGIAAECGTNDKAEFVVKPPNRRNDKSAHIAANEATIKSAIVATNERSRRTNHCKNHLLVQPNTH